MANHEEFDPANQPVCGDSEIEPIIEVEFRDSQFVASQPLTSILVGQMRMLLRKSEAAAMRWWGSQGIFIRAHGIIGYTGDEPVTIDIENPTGYDG